MPTLETGRPFLKPRSFPICIQATRNPPEQQQKLFEPPLSPFPLSSTIGIMAPLPPPPVRIPSPHRQKQANTYQTFSAALFWAKALLLGVVAIAGCVAIQGLLLGWFALLDAQVFLVLISARIVARAYDRATETPAPARVSRGTQTDGIYTPSHVRTYSRSPDKATAPTTTTPVKRLSAIAAPSKLSAERSTNNDGKSNVGESDEAVALGKEHTDNGPQAARVGQQSGKGSGVMIAKRPAARLVKLIENTASQGNSAPETSGLNVSTVGKKASAEEKPKSAATGGDNRSPAAEWTLRAAEHQQGDTRVAKTTQEMPEFGIQQAISATAAMTRKVEYPREIARRALADAFDERELARQRLNNAFSIARSVEFGEKAKFYKQQRKALANMMPLGLLNDEDEARFPYLGSMDTKPPPVSGCLNAFAYFLH